MSYVTFRIASNVTTHGVAYAVAVEIKKAKAKGLGEQAAITYGIEQVKLAITHAGLRK